MHHFASLETAHICDIWALLIICGWIVGNLSAMILQTKCKAGFGKRLVIGDQLSAISGYNAPLAVGSGVGYV